MTRRRTQIMSFALLALGVVGGTVGMIADYEDIGWIGLALAAIGIPLSISQTIRTTQQITEAQLAEAYQRGYRLALDHVLRGLLDPPAAPSPGTDGTTEHAPDNVITLPIRHPERKAQ